MKTIVSLRDFYAHALAMERAAGRYYAALAEQMRERRYIEAAETFHRLVLDEADHARRIENAAPDVLAAAHSSEIVWPDRADAMTAGEPNTPYRALRLALANEQEALAFLRDLVRNSANADVRRAAGELAAEEESHIARIEAALERTERGAPGVDHDRVPPRATD